MMGSEIRDVPGLWSAAFLQVCLYEGVTAALSVGALVTVNGPFSWEVAIKGWAAIFCAATLNKVSHASAVNGTITPGKVA